MNTTQRGLLTLLKSAITGEKLPLPEGFSLEAADKIVRRQSLLPLVYQGAYNCGISPKTELMQEYQKQYYRILIHDQRQMRAVRQLCEAFETNGIDYMPLKGCNLKQLYPQPEMRMMGDADILIRMEQYEKIRKVMVDMGYEAVVEHAHELTWNRNDLHLELHRHLIASEIKDLHPYFGTGWARAVPQGGCRYAMRPEDAFIFLFAHMMKHYRSSGIGCRQFLDLYVYRRACPDMDEAYIETEMARLHLLEFYRNVLSLLSVWFEAGIPNEKTDFMTDYILTGGNWGDLETEFCSRQVQESNGQSGQSRIRMLWRSLFLPLEKMQYSYPVLKKLPWLCPVFWPIRWVHLVICKPDMVRGKLRAINKATDDRVDARKRELNFVGLDFYGE